MAIPGFNNQAFRYNGKRFQNYDSHSSQTYFSYKDNRIIPQGDDLEHFWYRREMEFGYCNYFRKCFGIFLGSMECKRKCYTNTGFELPQHNQNWFNCGVCVTT